MIGNDRPLFDDDSQIAGRRSRDDGVRRIGDVLAELLDQYRVRFPEADVMVVEEPLAES